MAGGFDLTAQLHLQGPANLSAVVKNIKQQIAGISAPIKVTMDPKAAAAVKSMGGDAKKASQGMNAVAKSADKASASMTKVGQATDVATTKLTKFGEVAGLAVRRFAGFSIATGIIFGFIGAVTKATGAAISFERQLAKVSQVTGTSAKNLKSLTDEITRLSTQFGAASSDLIDVSRILAQAGLSARDTKIALEALAKTTLAPTFNNIQQTAEGAIASLRQFRLETKDLEGSLGSINAVAGKFAVEAEDIVAAIRRAGGVFAAASRGVQDLDGSLLSGQKQLQQFIALFTSVRATTRESAESIATGLRTIFSRIQRKSTIQYLKQFGIQLSDNRGRFVGVFEAVRRLNEGLKDLETRDIRFAALGEQLGGFRQIGKFIPLIKEFATAQEAYLTAQRGANSLTTQSAAALQTLEVRVQRVKEEFLALIREITQTESFKAIADSVLGLASGFIKIAKAAKPILPIITALGAVKGIGALKQIIPGFISGLAPDPEAKTLQKEQTKSTQANSGEIKKNTAAVQELAKMVKASIGKTPVSAGVLGKGKVRKNKGGYVGAFASGGMIRGPRGERDNLLASVEDGEYVVNREGVKRVGERNLDRMFNGGLKGLPTLARPPRRSPEHIPGIPTLAQAPRTGTGVPGIKTAERKTPENQERVNIRARRTVAGLFFDDPRQSKSVSDRPKFLSAKSFKGLDADTQRRLVRNTLDPTLYDRNTPRPGRGQSALNRISKNVSVQQKVKGKAGQFKKGQVPEGAIVKGPSKIVREYGVEKFLAPTRAFGIGDDARKKFEPIIRKHLFRALEIAANEFIPFFAPNVKGKGDELMERMNKKSLLGQLFEGTVAVATNTYRQKAKTPAGKDTLDFVIGPAQRPSFNRLFGPLPNNVVHADAKISVNDKSFSGLATKVANYAAERPNEIPTVVKRGGFRQRARASRSRTTQIARALGGFGAPNTILTPGEGVVPADEAKRQGLSRLMAMNNASRAGTGGTGLPPGTQIVPGQGNTDTVPANLEPGSFVIRKDSTEKLRGYNRGGLVGMERGGLSDNIRRQTEQALRRGRETAGTSRNLGFTTQALIGTARAQASKRPDAGVNLEKELLRIDKQRAVEAKKLEVASKKTAIAENKRNQLSQQVAKRQSKAIIDSQKLSASQQAQRYATTTPSAGRQILPSALPPTRVPIASGPGALDRARAAGQAVVGRVTGAGQAVASRGRALAGRGIGLADRGVAGLASAGNRAVAGIQSIPGRIAGQIDARRQASARLKTPAAAAGLRVLDRELKRVEATTHQTKKAQQAYRREMKRSGDAIAATRAGLAAGKSAPKQGFAGRLKGKFGDNALFGAFLAAPLLQEAIEKQGGRSAGSVGLGSAVSGGLLGAATGAQFGGAPGAVVGGIVGASGALSAKQARAVEIATENVSNSLKSLDDALKKFEKSGSLKDLDDAFNKIGKELKNYNEVQRDGSSSLASFTRLFAIGDVNIGRRAGAADLAAERGLGKQVVSEIGTAIATLDPFSFASEFVDLRKFTPDFLEDVPGIKQAIQGRKTLNEERVAEKQARFRATRAQGRATFQQAQPAFAKAQDTIISELRKNADLTFEQLTEGREGLIDVLAFGESEGRAASLTLQLSKMDDEQSKLIRTTATARGAWEKIREELAKQATLDTEVQKANTEILILNQLLKDTADSVKYAAQAHIEYTQAINRTATELLGGQAQLQAPARRNPFENFNAASQGDLTKTFDRLDRTIGKTNVGSRLRDEARGLKFLQEGLKDVATSTLRESAKPGADSAETIFGDKLSSLLAKAVEAGVSQDAIDRVRTKATEFQTGNIKGTQSRLEDRLLGGGLVEKATGQLAKNLTTAGSEIVKALNDIEKRYVESWNQIIQVNEKVAAQQESVNQKRIKNENKIAQALGKELTFEDKTRGLKSQLESLAPQGDDLLAQLSATKLPDATEITPATAGDRVRRALDERDRLEAQRKRLGEPVSLPTASERAPFPKGIDEVVEGAKRQEKLVELEKKLDLQQTERRIAFSARDIATDRVVDARNRQDEAQNRIDNSWLNTLSGGYAAWEFDTKPRNEANVERHNESRRIVALTDEIKELDKSISKTESDIQATKTAPLPSLPLGIGATSPLFSPVSPTLGAPDENQALQAARDKNTQMLDANQQAMHANTAELRNAQKQLDILSKDTVSLDAAISDFNKVQARQKAGQNLVDTIIGGSAKDRRELERSGISTLKTLFAPKTATAKDIGRAQKFAPEIGFIAGGEEKRRQLTKQVRQTGIDVSVRQSGLKGQEADEYRKFLTDLGAEAQDTPEGKKAIQQAKDAAKRQEEAAQIQADIAKDRAKGLPGEVEARKEAEKKALGEALTREDFAKFDEAAKLIANSTASFKEAGEALLEGAGVIKETLGGLNETLGRIPENIMLTGEHSMNIVVNGGTALAQQLVDQVRPAIEELIEQRTMKGVDPLGQENVNNDMKPAGTR